MSEERSKPEPSMEEILASIRRMIAEDTAQPRDPRPVPSAAGPAPERGEAARTDAGNILVLTDMVAEDGSVISLAAAGGGPGPADPGDPAAPLLSSQGNWRKPLLDRALREGDTASPATGPDQRLLSEDWTAASVALLRELMRTASHAGAPPLTADPELESPVRHALGPLLRDWLERHLSAIVERLVRDEIARIVARVEMNS